MPLAAEQLIDAAVNQHLVEAGMLAQLRLEARRKRVDLLETITAHYRFPVSALYQAAAEMRGLAFVNPLAMTPPTTLLKRIPSALAKRKLIMPIAEDAEGVLIVTADPDDRATLDTLQRLLGRPVRLAVAEPGALSVAIERNMPSPGQPSA